jgi:hypothetical protein
MEINIGDVYQRIGVWPDKKTTNTRIRILNIRSDKMIDVEELDDYPINNWGTFHTWFKEDLEDNNYFIKISSPKRNSHLPNWL